MTADMPEGPLDRLGLLLAWHGRITDTWIRRALGTTGLTPRHAMTLMHLGAGPVSQQSLVDKLDVDPSVLVTVLNDLEGGDLVHRRRDPADRRRHIVEITPEGSVTLGTLETALTKVENELFADLSEQERTTLRALLKRLASAPADYEC
ncbi:MarR family winged helix-turn-helix transcriptional regulator [Streptomyces diastatochromogenes]|uniref:MarR family transcriptional regulator n=1 Tax=Streptomyces diastatochromogenes TaxID=42236 RepID=A0A233RTQ4_STRDA|nr:MarR family winged helix-turn-helix transcriptional regulator [Streptomyces diastatochromogenes]MCZ0984811.1 MarR family winged helix-turn-helix transcriptional regulator [Streptomyces diastatochromogenes]OXY86761.1 MarR family transcriptional regulator [Streptomyces diastatochromogenes]